MSNKKAALKGAAFLFRRVLANASKSGETRKYSMEARSIGRSLLPFGRIFEREIDSTEPFLTVAV
jgi:hypothetical protein